MVEKKTRKKAKRKKAARKTDPTTEDTATDLNEAQAAPEAVANAEAPPAEEAAAADATSKPTGKRAARKKATTTRKRTARKKKATDTTAADSAAQSVDSKVVTEPKVAEREGAIVIEFPPVAPFPFRARAVAPPPERPAPFVPPPPPAADPVAVEDEDEDEPDDEVAPLELDDHDDVHESEPEPGPEVALEEEPEAAPPRERGRRDEFGDRLTPSQKRRLRRRRSRKRRGPEDERESTAEADEPPHGAERAAALFEELEDEPGETFDVEELGEAPEPVAEVAPEADLVEHAADAGEELPERDRRRRRRRRGRRSAQHELPEDAPVAAEPMAPAKKSAPTTLAQVIAAKRTMIINAVPREECRIAILNNGKLEEIYLERATAESHVGNIYKGVVTNVEPSIQAAFIDFGQGKNGFLHISDLHPQYFPDGAGQTENVGHKMPRRHRPPIQRCLRRGQEVQVQVTKEGIGTKGPTLTTYLSIPGRFLVMMPGMRRLGVSRRIEDDESRDELRKVLAQLELPEGMGYIARTAALDRPKRELQSDLSYLQRLWNAVEKRLKHDPAPAELYRESDLVIRTIRDVFTSDVERIIVDDEDVAERAREFLSIFSPRSRDTVELYDHAAPIFHHYGIESELERLHSRHVPLKSGGSLVIDQTEALVAIDVNSGRFRTEDDAEQTAYKINLEAADEIPRQLRLRDLGGVVVCDFIDMRMESHRRDIERRLIRNLKEHKERAKVLRMSAFGMIEMTRQRQRASLTRSVYQDCRHCRGTGLVKTVESVALDVMRLIQLSVSRDHISMIEVSVSPDVALLLLNRKRRLIASLEQQFRRTISIRPEPHFSIDQVEVRCTDARGRVVPHL